MVQHWADTKIGKYDFFLACSMSFCINEYEMLMVALEVWYLDMWKACILYAWHILVAENTKDLQQILIESMI